MKERKKSSGIEIGDISWEDEVPISNRHDDVYFSKHNGYQESRYVFLENNFLPKRWSKNPKLGKSSTFTIFETGFGTGLNFLATWKTWLENKDENRPLHYVSIEKYPLAQLDIQRSQQCWPELSELSTAFIDQYPYLTPGMHQLSFENGLITLTLIFGDINDQLDNYIFNTDAYYLDGFAPSKNESMWTPKLFDFMAQRANPDATFATFTAAGFVKRGLSDAGFDVAKVKGFGRKREMLRGIISSRENFGSALENAQTVKRWSIPEPTPIEKLQGPNTNDETVYDVAIVGSGLSGLTSALALSKEGLRVALIERNSNLTSEASGQTQLAHYAKLPAYENKEFRLTLQSMTYSQRYFTQLQMQSVDFAFWHQTGLLQLLWNDKEKAKAHKLINNNRLPETLFQEITAEQASELTGLALAREGIWCQNSGWLDPKSFSAFVSNHTNIESITNFAVNSLEFDKGCSLWSVNGDSEKLTAKHVVLCTANATTKFEQSKHLPVKPIRGQVTSIKSKELPSTKTVICGEGYLCPPVAGIHHFGATYDLDCSEDLVTNADNQRNIDTINKWLPNWLNEETAIEENLTGAAGLRCTTPDYMPIVGYAPISDAFIEDFEKLRVNANACQTQYGKYHPKLFVNLGHGSKGLVTTPISAQLIASLICDKPLPVTAEQYNMLSPARFLIKHLSQRRL